MGNYRSVCGNCHIRGHRADGNRNKNACKSTPCTSYFTCGQKQKHPEHFEEIRKVRKEIKDVSREIDDASLEKRNITAFQSKSISAFASAITPRLTRVFGDKYSLKTAQGKLQLQKDISILRAACNNKIPENTGNDQELFTLLLEKQTNAICVVKNTCHDSEIRKSNVKYNNCRCITSSSLQKKEEIRKKIEAGIYQF